MAFAAAIPAIAGAVAGGAMKMGGGLMDYFLEQKSFYDQMKQARDFAQNSIQWRVRDAEKAGIHPLYALGAPTMSSFPMTMESHIGSGLQDMGQSVGDVVRRMDPHETLMRGLEEELMRANIAKTEAEKAVADSEAEKNVRAYRSSIPYLDPQDVERSKAWIYDGPFEQHPDNPRFYNDRNPAPADGSFELKPQEVAPRSSGNRSSSAGENPGYEEIEFAPGFHMMVPRLQGESFPEVWEQMSLTDKAALLNRNSNIYGDGWFRKWLNLMKLGIAPKPHERFESQAEHRRKSFHPEKFKEK